MNGLRAALDRGDVAVGGWMATDSPLAAELLAAAGFAWVLVDLQHGATTWETLPGVIGALERQGSTAVVRVPWSDPASVMRVLDLGAGGVLVPMVSTVAEARRAAAASRYPPVGGRSYGPLGATPPSISTANNEVVCIVMIETRAGLINAEKIAAVSGVDALFLGPVDLGLDLSSVPDGSGWGAEVRRALASLVQIARAHGTHVATIARDAEHAYELTTAGVDIVTIGSDRAYLRNGAAGALRGFTERRATVD
jgi:4-hydroxy-2-oxoheptanedioate aldolase